jgi:aryl-alcohol dehydrogenase-like predicted oxidoreductase
MNLKDYVTLGRSGLCVSPLCLGTMTFGTAWGWGADETASREIFGRYIDAGGNFVDTANRYTNGASEEMLGKFIGESSLRDRVVLATKFTLNTDPDNPNAGGNGRKNIFCSLDGSLRRLKTDYVDLYWLHAWDTRTPVEEVLSTLQSLVHAGKIRYYGFSDTPAWYIARAYTLAEKEGLEGPIALQLEYSLVERSIEREHVPAAQEFGLGICPWSPLAGGFLSGKYRPEGDRGRGEGRLTAPTGTVFERFTERNWPILESVREVARQIGKTPSQVALNWAATQPGMTATILGATRIAQLEENLRSVEFAIPPELRKRLEDVSALEPAHPYVFFSSPRIRGMINGNASVRKWSPVEIYKEETSAAAASVKAGSGEN